MASIENSWFPPDLPSGAVTIEPGSNPPAIVCDCCGTWSRTVNGFLYRDGSACAVYLADWTEGHVVDEGLDLFISVGEWGVADGRRRTIALRCRTSEDSFQFMVLDPEAHRLARRWTAEKVRLLGSLVDRHVALRHPEMPEVFRLAEHVISDDQRVSSALVPT